MSRVVVGIVRCARGRADGIDCFDATREGFLASLAPLVVFPVLLSAVVAGQAGLPAGIVELLVLACAVLAVPVLTHLVSRWMAREAAWLRLATAANWCQWIMPMLAVMTLWVLLALSDLFAPWLTAKQVVGGVLAACSLYWLWLQWFLARHGLGVSRWRAAVAVVAVHGGAALLVSLPGLLI